MRLARLRVTTGMPTRSKTAAAARPKAAEAPVRCSWGWVRFFVSCGPSDGFVPGFSVAGVPAGVPGASGVPDVPGVSGVWLPGVVGVVLGVLGWSPGVLGTVGDSLGIPGVLGVPGVVGVSPSGVLGA